MVCTPTVDASDPRISGSTVNRSGSDDHIIDGVEGNGFSWGEMTITNDGGSWVGTWMGLSMSDAESPGGDLQFMIGKGGYEGLAAAWREMPGSTDREILLDGIILAGDLPPTVNPEIPE